MSGVFLPGGKGDGRAEDAGVNGVLLTPVSNYHVLETKDGLYTVIILHFMC